MLAEVEKERNELQERLGRLEGQVEATLLDLT